MSLLFGVVPDDDGNPRHDALAQAEDKVRTLEEQNRQLKERLHRETVRHQRQAGTRSGNTSADEEVIDYSDVKVLMGNDGRFDTNKVMQMVRENHRLQNQVKRGNVERRQSSTCVPMMDSDSDVVQTFGTDDIDDESSDNGAHVTPVRAMPRRPSMLNPLGTSTAEKTVDGCPRVNGDGVLSRSIFDPQGADLSNKYAFIKSRCKRGIVNRFRVVRESKNNYMLYIEPPDGTRMAPLMAGQYEKVKKRPRVSLSLHHKDFSRSSANYVGCASYSTLFPQYIAIEDCTPSDPHTPTGQQQGREVAFMAFMPGDGHTAKHNLVIAMPASEEPLRESLIAKYEDGCRDSIFRFKNKAPTWNEAAGAYCLNYHGRVTKGSVKNFQLVQVGVPETDATAPIICWFGRCAHDPKEYVLDVSYPLSPLVAFAVTIFHLSLL
eukprot:Rmarinus@m.19005